MEGSRCGGASQRTGGGPGPGPPPPRPGVQWGLERGVPGGPLLPCPPCGRRRSGCSRPKATARTESEPPPTSSPAGGLPGTASPAEALAFQRPRRSGGTQGTRPLAVPRPAPPSCSSADRGLSAAHGPHSGPRPGPRPHPSPAPAPAPVPSPRPPRLHLGGSVPSGPGGHRRAPPASRGPLRVRQARGVGDPQAESGFRTVVGWGDPGRWGRPQGPGPARGGAEPGRRLRAHLTAHRRGGGFRAGPAGQRHGRAPGWSAGLFSARGGRRAGAWLGAAPPQGRLRACGSTWLATAPHLPKKSEHLEGFCCLSLTACFS